MICPFGENIVSYTDKRTELPVYSLYGDDISESEKALTSLDTVIFDIQNMVAITQEEFDEKKKQLFNK